MNLIEEAAKRLRQLEAAGVARSSHAPQDGAQPRLVPAEPGKRPPEARPAPARTLDLARLQASGFITPALQHSKLMQEFRLIKRPLIQHALGRSATQTPNRKMAAKHLRPAVDQAPGRPSRCPGCCRVEN